MNAIHQNQQQINQSARQLVQQEKANNWIQFPAFKQRLIKSAFNQNCSLKWKQDLN